MELKKKRFFYRNLYYVFILTIQYLKYKHKNSFLKEKIHLQSFLGISVYQPSDNILVWD